MPDIPNIPQIPKRWDQLLFVAGLGLMYFNQGNKWCFLFGIFLLGVGVIIALSPIIDKIVFKEEPTYEEGKSFFFLYLFLSGAILFIVILLSAVFIQI